MANLDEQLLLFERELSGIDAGGKGEGQSSNGSTNNSTQSASSSSKLFVPNQVRAPPQFGQGALRQPVVNHTIESGPELYKNSSKSNQKDDDQANKQQKYNPNLSMLKTMALPSDVELLAAKRQSSKALQNSYLGAVLRGEKKMKKFVRSCGGETWEDPSLADWDPNDFRIFCGDLGNEVSDELLAKAFRKYPSFQKAKVVRDGRTNKSKGYGFVSFKNQEDFVRAMREMDGKYVGNRPIKLRKSNWKDRNVDSVRKKFKEKKKLGLT